MRYAIVMLCLLLGLAAPVAAQLSISIGVPGVSIGLSVPVFPRLMRVPGYPVYYAPVGQLLLLRGPVLGLPGRRLVCQFLVRRPLGPGVARGRALVRAAHPGALLPQPARVLSWLARRRTAALVRAIRKRYFARSRPGSEPQLARWARRAARMARSTSAGVARETSASFSSVAGSTVWKTPLSEASTSRPLMNSP